MTLDSSTRLSLLASLIKGNSASESWPLFCEKYGRLLYRWAIRWGASPHDAEEIMQETMLLIYQKLGQYYSQPRSNFRSWLKTVAYRCWLQLIAARDEKCREGFSFRLDPEMLRLLCSPVASQDLFNEFDRLAISEILELASERVKSRVEVSSWACFEMMYVEKVSGPEIAEALGMQLSTVYSCISRVRHQLKEEIRRIDDTLES
jgi:RNA polymerase sigma factor (sigma-70 family)